MSLRGAHRPLPQEHQNTEVLVAYYTTDMRHIGNKLGEGGGRAKGTKEKSSPRPLQWSRGWCGQCVGREQTARCHQSGCL